jgi:hypothetical protein
VRRGTYFSQYPFNFLLIVQFFVSLWDTLQNRAKDTEGENKLAGNMTLNQVRQHTSRVLGTVSSDGSKFEGSMFDIHIELFNRFRNKIETQIIQALQYSFPLSFKPYFIKPQWRTVGDELVPGILFRFRSI